MKRSALLLAGLLALGTPLAGAEHGPHGLHPLQDAQTDSDRVDAIVESLRSGNAGVREQAFNELLALDQSAVKRLKHHAESDDTPADVRAKLEVALANHGVQPAGKKAGGLVIKAKKGPGAVVRIEGEAVRISVSKGGKSFEFRKPGDGSIHVKVRKDGKEVEYDFDSETDLAQSDGEIHRVFKQANVRAQGEAAPADMSGEDPGPGAREGNAQALRDFNDRVRRFRNGQLELAEGDLTDEEIKALADKARERLQKDMAKLETRERKNALERDPEERAEESWEIKFARYRSSLRALERDLLYRIARLRKPGGDKFERNLDNLHDKIKDTFADLHDAVDDKDEVTWGDTLNKARKYHEEFGKQVDAWANKIGVNPDLPNAREIVVSKKRKLISRLERLRKIGGNKYEDQLDDLEERIYDSFENIEEKIEESPPANWAKYVEDSEKFYIDYSAQLDGWARQIGVDESLPSPLERLADMKRELRDAIRDLRRIGGEEYENVIDEINDNVNDTFADLKDKILDSARPAQAKVLEDATRFHRTFMDSIEMWERKIIGADRIERESPENPKERGIVEDYPEKDVKLPKGERMDVVEGVRIARLLPLPKRQLGLDHGLSVNEIVDADKALARAGVEVYDIILKVGETKVDTRTDLRDAMGAIKKDSEFEITILRDGEELTLSTTK